MIKSAEQQIREYLIKNKKATRDDVVRDVFCSYVGGKGSQTRKALNRFFTLTK